MIKKILLSKVNTFIFVVVGYFLIHYINFSLTDFSYLMPGAHLVHIPSGFKLLFVLLTGWIGALGIAIATLIASNVYRFPGEYVLSLQLAVMSGAAPLLARKLLIDHFALNEDLSHITAKQLITIGLVFAILNSGLHQAVLYWRGMSISFLDGVLVTFIGDMTGAYIVFLLLRLLTKKLSKADESQGPENH